MVYFHATERPDDEQAEQPYSGESLAPGKLGRALSGDYEEECRYSDDTRTALEHLRTDLVELHARVHSMMYAADVLGPEHGEGEETWHELGSVWNELHAVSGCLNVALHVAVNANKEARS